MKNHPPRWRCALAGAIIVLAVLIAPCVLAGISAGAWLPGLGHWLEGKSNPAPADAVVVLSGGRERLLQGMDLYRAGYGRELWYTGYVTPTYETYAIEAELARQAALRMGVPPGALRMLPSTSTWEDGQAIAAQARQEGVRRIVLVTGWFHIRRGVCVVRHQLAGTGVQVSYQAAPNSKHNAGNWWQSEEGLMSVFGEVAKFGLYWVKYGLSPFEC